MTKQEMKEWIRIFKLKLEYPYTEAERNQQVLKWAEDKEMARQSILKYYSNMRKEINSSLKDFREMKHNLTTEQLARVFGERIGQKFITPVDSIQTLYEISVKIADTWLNEIYNIKGCTLLLTPLEKISDEHAIQCLCLFYKYDNPRIVRKVRNNICFNTDVPNEEVAIALDMLSCEEEKFLILNGYDVPMFFGIDHPDNGKTLIDLGVAIDKTTI